MHRYLVNTKVTNRAAIIGKLHECGNGHQVTICYCSYCMVMSVLQHDGYGSSLVAASITADPISAHPMSAVIFTVICIPSGALGIIHLFDLHILLNVKRSNPLLDQWIFSLVKFSASFTNMIYQ